MAACHTCGAGNVIRGEGHASPSDTRLGFPLAAPELASSATEGTLPRHCSQIEADLALIRFVLHAVNLVLILAMIGCIAGALAGLIVLLPFVGGAWGLNLMALLAYENNWGPDSAPRTVRVAAASERATAAGVTRQPAAVLAEQERTVLAQRARHARPLRRDSNRLTEKRP